jgi:hypothetical protein
MLVGWRSLAVKGFWTLSHNIYKHVCCNRCHGFVLIYSELVMGFIE